MQVSLFHFVLFIAWLLLPSAVIAERFCDTISNTTMYDPDKLDPLQFGNANMLKPFWRQPWPRLPESEEKLRPIRYCYVNKVARVALHCKLMPAFGVWAKALGWDHEKNGHSVCWRGARLPPKADGSFRELLSCFLEGTQDWNPAVPEDTLAIHLRKGATPSATIGYTRSGRPGRHRMTLPENPSLPQVVHEVGISLPFSCSHQAILTLFRSATSSA